MDLLLAPNLLTVFRILSIIPVIILFENGFNNSATAILILSFLTDFLDGFIARKFNLVSYTGTILDPVADKLLVISFFSYFFIRGYIPVFYFSLILVRDIAQLSSIPILLFWKKIQFKVKPSLIAKCGTAMNYIILGVTFLNLFFQTISGSDLYFYGFYSLLLISGGIELFILFTYIPRFFQILNRKHDTFE